MRGLQAGLIIWYTIAMANNVSSQSTHSLAVFCLGSNIEPRLDYLDRAQKALAALPETRLVAASETEETEPVDVPAEHAQARFLNRLVVVETGLAPHELSRRMHAIEDVLGRTRGSVRNLPRTIDIDMIDYEGVTSDDPELTLPHPRAHERAFVMAPLRRLGLRLGALSEARSGCG